MSTRSRIGVIRSKTEVESVYCHFDGYPSGVGAKLRDHWTDHAAVERLIALGDLSQLGSEIGSKHGFDNHVTQMRDEGTDWCLFYERDRGEEEVGSKLHQATEWPDYGQEYEYLFDPSDRSWRCRALSFRNGPGPWLSLETAIRSDS